MVETSRRDRFAEEYRARLPALDAFRVQLEGLIRVLLTNDEREVHQIESRCKSIDAFRDKLARKAYADPLREMTDLVGLRIITYYDADVALVAHLVAREFKVDEARSVDWRIPGTADRFGYQSLHLVVALDDRRSLLPEWATFRDLLVEIQVRTVLQHAWAVASHQLTYKRAPLTEAGQRRLARLAALLETAGEELASLRFGEGQYSAETGSPAADVQRSPNDE